MFRPLGRNTVVYAVGNVALRGVAFVLLPLYTHGLSIEDYGRLAAILLTVEFLWMTMGLGMLDAVVRFGDKGVNGMPGQLIGTATCINLAGGILASAVCYAFLSPLFAAIWQTDSQIYILLACGAALGQSLFLQSVAQFRIQNQAGRFVIASVVAAVAILVLTVVFVNGLNLGITGVLLAQTLAYAAVTTLVIFALALKERLSFSIALAKQLLRFGFPLVFAMVGRRAIGGVAIYMLTLLAGMHAVAVYSVGSRVAQILAIVLILPFQLAFQPMLFSNLASPNIKAFLSRVLTYLAFAATVLSFAIVVASKSLLPLIAPAGYEQAYRVILLSLPALALQGVSYFGEGLLNIRHQSQHIGVTYVAGALLCVLLSDALITRYGVDGALLAYNLSYALISFTLLGMGLRVFPFAIEWRRILVTAGLFTLLLAGIALAWSLGDMQFYAVSATISAIFLIILKVTAFFKPKELQFMRNTPGRVKHRLMHSLFKKPDLRRG